MSPGMSDGASPRCPGVGVMSASQHDGRAPAGGDWPGPVSARWRGPGGVRRRSPYVSSAPVRGDEPILLVPAFLAGDATLRLMNRSLRQEGSRTYRAATRSDLRDHHDGQCARESFARARAALPNDVAFTAVFSRRDGIVDWRACIDPVAAAVEDRSSHVGSLPQPPKSIAEKSRSFESWCSAVIERIVPLRERITSECVVAPPPR